MKVLAIIQARMNSERLPNKVLKTLGGKPMLVHIIERAKQSYYIDKVVVASTVQEEDKQIGKVLKDYETKVYYGNIYNVLDRFYKVAQVEKADIIVRLTGDNPLIDSSLLDKAIQVILENPMVDYVKSTGYPLGMNIEVFTFKALQKCFEKATLAYEKEHVTPYIYCNPEQFNLVYLKNDKDLEHIRLTCDTEEDFKLIHNIYDYFKDKGDFKMQDILDYLKDNPKLMQINATIKQKNFKESDKRGGKV